MCIMRVEAQARFSYNQPLMKAAEMTLGDFRRHAKAPRRVARWACALLAMAALAGCPPTRQPIPPLAHPPVIETAPPIGTTPTSDGVYVPMNLTGPLTGDLLARATVSQSAMEQDAQKAATTLGVAPAATMPATTQTDLPEANSQAVRYYREGREKFIEGSNIDAMDALDKALRIDPNAFAILRLMGRVCFASNQLARGSLYLQRAAAVHPDDTEVNYLLGRYWLERKEYNTSIYYLLRAGRGHDLTPGTPLYPLIRFYLARTQQAAGYLQLAGQCYETFLTEISEPSPAYRYDRELEYLMEQDWAVQLDAAECCAAVGNLNAALAHYQSALEHHPDSDYIAARVAITQVRLGTYPDAIATALGLTDLARASDESIKFLLWVYRAAGLQDKIMEDLQTRAIGQADASVATLALAGVQQHLGQHDAAVATLARYLHGKPADTVILQRLVALAKQSDAYVPGFTALVGALHANPPMHEEIVSMLWDLFGKPPRQDALPALMQAFPPDACGPDSNYLLGILYASTGDDIQSVNLLEKALAARPESWPIREACVSMLLIQEQFAKAQKVVQDALALHLGGADARRLMVETELAQQRYAQALKLALNALADFPDNSQLRIQVASIYAKRQQWTQAATTLRDMIVKFPKFQTAYELLIKLDLGVMQNPKEAIDTLDHLVREIPTSRYGQSMNAEYLLANGHSTEAEQLLIHLLAQTPNDPDVTVQLAALYKKASRADDAIALLQEYLKRNKPEPVVVDGLAGLYDLANRKNDGLALYEKYYKQNLDSELWLRLYAAALARQGHNNDAEALLRQGLERYPKSLDMVLLLAEFLQTNDRTADAVPVLRHFIDSNGVTTDRLYLLVHYLEDSNQHDQAVTTLQRILAIMPDHTGANNDLGYFWADLGIHLNQAEQLINRALDNEPNNAAFLDSIGWVHYKKGQFTKAVEELTQAVSHPEGQDPELLTHLGDALYRVGRRDEARERYEQAKSQFDQLDKVLQKAPLAARINNALRQFREGSKVDTAEVGKQDE